MANPWRDCSGLFNGCDINSAPLLRRHPLAALAWEARADGPYTVRLGVTTSGNNNFASCGFFGDICVQASSPVVPEPSARALWTTGALLTASRRFRGQ